MTGATAGAEEGILRITTPEEVPLSFRPAGAGQRLTALTIDAVLLLGGLFLAGVLLVLVRGEHGLERPGPALTLFLLVSFALRNFYFIASELHWSGRTPGKRIVGLRVLARDGGPLTSDLVFARNLTRELEFFVPVQVLLSGAYGLMGANPWVAGLTLLWILALGILPLTNRWRARLGDLLAGTVVVSHSEARLERDVVERSAPRSAEGTSPARYRFTQKQLDIYGIYELQVLEDVLRQGPETVEPGLLRDICGRIRRKIEWPADEEVEPIPFLRDFYAAQRGRLEREMLFGRRRTKKRF